ncbi:MAG TPA: FHA domain-containing protein, partial [Gemmataceae bacterium]|nr:FHA domain-containing protein [Gemmataceae bacterium]
MSFKVFIYYCALCGGWAALAAWAVAFIAGFTRDEVSTYASTTLIAGMLGLLLAAIIGLLDALLNSVGSERILRMLVALVVGLVGGLLGGVTGELLHQEAHAPRFFGWMLVGLAIGASIGVYDLFRALASGQAARQATRKVINGIIGGVLGGLVGGVLFEWLVGALDLPRSSLAIGLVVVGLCIGFLIGLAQVILKEAWLRVETGFKPGRELIVSKSETTIGRSETCDVGLFGDPSIEKVHARVVLQGNGYLLADSGSQGGT